MNIIKKSTQDVPSAINGIQDLAGKTVSVGTGSVSEHWVNSYNAQLHPSDQKVRFTSSRSTACSSLVMHCAMDKSMQ